MASKLLPSHALPRLTAAATATTRVALCARQARLALPAFSSPSPLYSHFLSCAAAAASPAVAGRRRGGALVVARAAEGNEPAETPEDDAAANDEEAGVSEEEEEKELEPPRKPIVKLGDIMGILHKRAIEASDKGRPVPDLRAGDVVEIKLSVPRKRRKVSFYKGVVLSKQSAGIDTTIRIRRIIAGIGVEIVFPVYSPSVLDIKVIGRKKVRRAKLYYLRDKLPRFSTVK